MAKTTLAGIPKQDHARVRERLALVRKAYSPKAIYETLQASDARREAEDKALEEAIARREALLEACKQDSLLSERHKSIETELALIEAQAHLLAQELELSDKDNPAHFGLMTLRRQVEGLKRMVGRLFEEATEEEDRTIGRLP